MQKPYDLKDLGEKLKAEGLEVAEDGAKKAIKAVSAWVQESAKASATPFDDIALIVLPKLEEVALKEADKIDGHEG